MPEFRSCGLLPCLLCAIAAPCYGASTEELRLRCTDAADFEKIHPDKAIDYITDCVKRLEKDGPARRAVPQAVERRAPVGFDDDF